jgi:hypothetical protein
MLVFTWEIPALCDGAELGVNEVRAGVKGEDEDPGARPGG